MYKFSRHYPDGMAERARMKKAGYSTELRRFQIPEYARQWGEILASFPVRQKWLALSQQLKNNPWIRHLGIFWHRTSLDALTRIINNLQGNTSLWWNTFSPALREIDYLATLFIGMR